MKNILNSIIEECAERNIPVNISKHSSGKFMDFLNLELLHFILKKGKLFVKRDIILKKK